MSGKVFLDTNIFLYSYDTTDPRKHSIANDLIRSVAVSGEGTISYQVIQEFFNVALRKSASKLRSQDAQQYLTTTFRPLLVVPSSFSIVSDAIDIQERYRLSGTTASSLRRRSRQAASCFTRKTFSTASSSAL